MVYGNLFPNLSETELASLKVLGLRWKEYEKSGVWVYEEHSFWITLVPSLPSFLPFSSPAVFFVMRAEGGLGDGRIGISKRRHQTSSFISQNRISSSSKVISIIVN